MMKKLLRITILLAAVFAFTTVSAQITDFSTDLSGWGKSWGAHGDVTHDTTEGVTGDGALKLVRITDNANFGIKVGGAVTETGIDATANKYIRIRFKNGTAATILNFGGKNGDNVAIKNDTGGTISFSIGANSTEYSTLYIDLSDVALWSGAIENLFFQVKNGQANDAGGAFYLDEIEFSNSAPENTYSEFILNPSFEGPSGISHLTGNKAFATRALSTSETHDGVQSLQTTFSANADASYWAFSNYEKTYDSKYPVGSDIQVKMWVKSSRTSVISMSGRVKLTDAGEETATKPIATVTTTNTAGEWEELTFDLKSEEEFDGVTFWFSLNYTAGEATNLVSGDVVYIDQMTATISAATAGVNNNVLEGTATYPNPASDFLNVKCPINSKVSLFNILGAKVKSVNNTSERLKISVSDLPKGIYLLKINSENKTKTTKVIIK